MEPIAIMLRKDDPAFKRAVDESIVAMMKSGEIARLYDRWFMQPIPPANRPHGAAAQRRHPGGLGRAERQAGRGLPQEVKRCRPCPKR